VDPKPGNAAQAPPARDILRGSAAFALPTFLILAVMMVIASVSAVVNADEGRGLLAFNLVSIVVLVGLVFVVAGRVAATHFPGRLIPLGMLITVAVAMPVVTLAALALEFAVLPQGLPSGVSIREVLLLRPALIPIYLLSVYVVGLRRWYADERTRVLRALVDARASALVASGALAATLAGAVEDARTMSSGSRAAADELLARALTSDDAASPARAADALRDTARTSVRSSGHEVWRSSQDIPDSVSWREVLSISMRAHPLPIVPLAVVALWLSIARSSAVWGVRPAGGLLTAAVFILWAAIVFRIGRMCIARLRRLALVITVAAVAVALLVVWASPSGWLDPRVVAIASGAGALSALVFFFSVTLAGSVLLTARDSAGAVVVGLQEARREAEVDQRVLEEANARLSRDVAQHVHSTVQPGLVAASIAIDEAVKGGDRTALHRALEDARVALDADFVPPPSVAEPSLTDVLDDLRARWLGLLDVQLPAALPALVPGQVEAADAVIEECLNNAYIHGGARHARVEVSEAPDGRTVVVVTDDGSGPGAGAPGLGSAIITHATRGEWTRTAADGGGSVVRAVLREFA